MRRLTTEEFIKRAKEVHGGKYNYDKVQYKNYHTHVCITCPEHGDFWQKPLFHLQGCGCPKCGILRNANLQRSNKEEFISKARKVHGDKYDYSKVEYINNYTKVLIICPKHGGFWQKPNEHVSSRKGCPFCSKEKSRFSTLDFIEKAKRKHVNLYDYSKVNYIDIHTKVCIICKKHGEFWQEPNSHLRGSGCPKCNKVKAGESLRLSNDEFIKKSIIIHGYKYDYSKVNYIGTASKVCIICPEHGEFWQNAGAHLSGCGCPQCKSSHGELEIEEYLKNNNINYEAQYNVKLQELMFSRNNLKVDFYLPEYNTFVEFNGIQHYKRIPYFHKTEEDFQMQAERDKRLKDYCKENKIKLIVIKYNQIDNIDKILNSELKLNNKQ